MFTERSLTMAIYQGTDKEHNAEEILDLIDRIDRQIEFGIPLDCPMAVGRPRNARDRMPYEVWSSLQIGRINRMLGRIEIEAEASKQDLGNDGRITGAMVAYVIRTARAVGVRR
jgi:hypothetical protein